ncbi:uncharacterized protein PITG_23150 [Phytophthora infestans T30-4]|uniref:Secreted protein n=1 Tax=Phytophthora infestans (strain T30-4) TaxID=403677 RepID=D0NYR4_PHYIT|nr:uncharacterized protein PITG_23150 [Phytophthora infestans T30-4]EEY68693.1 conserved hypothetical protein [Phytophthora infestans T30-4]|eukprot:XP_002997499.1 conserved hypothetical protein [Phytophthora infestans T30-4]
MAAVLTVAAQVLTSAMLLGHWTCVYRRDVHQCRTVRCCPIGTCTMIGATRTALIRVRLEVRGLEKFSSRNSFFQRATL